MNGRATWNKVSATKDEDSNNSNKRAAWGSNTARTVSEQIQNLKSIDLTNRLRSHDFENPLLSNSKVWNHSPVKPSKFNDDSILSFMSPNSNDISIANENVTPSSSNSGSLIIQAPS